MRVSFAALLPSTSTSMLCATYPCLPSRCRLPLPYATHDAFLFMMSVATSLDSLEGAWRMGGSPPPEVSALPFRPAYSQPSGAMAERCSSQGEASGDSGVVGASLLAAASVSRSGVWSLTTLHRQPVPTELPLLEHSGSTLDPPQQEGTWKVVVHTGGKSHLSKSQWEYLQYVPGKSGRPWQPEGIVTGRASPLCLDYGIHIHVGQESAYQLWDVEETKGKFKSIAQS